MGTLHFRNFETILNSGFILLGWSFLNLKKCLLSRSFVLDMPNDFNCRKWYNWGIVFSNEKREKVAQRKLVKKQDRLRPVPKKYKYENGGRSWSNGYGICFITHGVKGWGSNPQGGYLICMFCKKIL